MGRPTAGISTRGVANAQNGIRIIVVVMNKKIMNLIQTAEQETDWQLIWLAISDSLHIFAKLIQRCPEIINDLSLQEIASFLNISPGYLSTIRKEITFSDKK